MAKVYVVMMYNYPQCVFLNKDRALEAAHELGKEESMYEDCEGNTFYGVEVIEVQEGEDFQFGKSYSVEGKCS